VRVAGLRVDAWKTLSIRRQGSGQRRLNTRPRRVAGCFVASEVLSTVKQKDRPKAVFVQR
jgi:hypothetical protein